MEHKYVIMGLFILLTLIGGIILSNSDKLSGYHDKVVLKASGQSSVTDFAKLQDALSQNPSIKSVEIDRQERQLTIVYDPQRITQFDLLRLAEKADLQARIEGRPVTQRQKIPRGCCGAF